MKYEPNESSTEQAHPLNGVSTDDQVPASESNFVSEQSSGMSAKGGTASSTKITGVICNCEPCLERRCIEADQHHKKLIHAKTQIHHLISCIYHGAYFYTSIDPEELKSCVDLLMSQEPDLLFRKVDILCQEYVSGMNTRFMQILTNGYDTPILAYNFVESMFNDYTRLISCSSKLITCFPQLEKHLDQFNHETLEKHHTNLFQSMIFNQVTINKTLSEIVNQLRQGSAQYETKHENKFTAALMRFHKFETKMHEVRVTWRDAQMLLDDYHNQKAEERQSEKQQSPPQPPEAVEKWEFYHIEQETARQLRSKKSKTLLGKAEKAKLSVTLRKTFASKPSSSTHEKVKNSSPGQPDNESESDPAFGSPMNSDESLSEVHFQPPLTPTSDANPFLCSEYLQNIRPPSVPSGDSDASSDDNGSPQIQGHSHLVTLEPEHDSIGSLSPQPCTNDVADAYTGLDFQTNNIPLHSTSRPFLPTHQHLHQLQKQLFNPSEPSSHVVTPRAPSPSVKTKTESASNCFAQSESNVRVSNESSFEDNNSNSPSAMFDSAAAEILADLPQFFGDLCKDAWSSPSSSSSLSNSVVSFAKDSSVTRTRSRSVKLKKKKKSISRSKQKIFTDSDTTDNNSQVLFQDAGSVGGDMSHFYDDSNDASKDENDDEDADDEYDEDEDQNDLCKCSKCQDLMKSYQDLSYFIPKTDQHNYRFQDLDPALKDDPSCKCTDCVHLANASNFFAAQSSQVLGNVATFTQGDITDPNHQSPFYNQNIPPHFLIQPQLYDFHPMGSNAAIGQFYGQAPPTLSSVENQFNDPEKQSASPKTEESSQQEAETSSGGNLFQHLVPSSSSGWGGLGKSPDAKFLASQNDATPTSLHDWPVSSHQAWLPTHGNMLPHQILSPGCASAFQHYISTRPQGFFSPFLSNTNQPPGGSYFPPLTDSDNSYNSSVEVVSSSSPSSMSSVNSSSQSTLFANSSTLSSSTPTLTSSSSAFTPTSSKYFPSLYAQIPRLTTSSASPFTLTPSTSSGSVLSTSAPHSLVQGQPIHFHPGTSVSLKDGGTPFNLPLHDGTNLMFNQALTQLTAERPGLQPASTPNVFTIPTTLNQTSCLPPNPFLQSSSSHTGLLGYPNTQGQNPAAPGSNVGLSSMNQANSLQIRNHILRRKKLVAQSKLSKQPRPQQQQQQQQHVIKSHDPSMSGDNQLTLIHQKLPRPQLQPVASKSDAGPTSLDPPSGPQTTSTTFVTSPSSDGAATVNQPPVKEVDIGKASAAQTNASIAESQSAVNSAKQPEKPQAVSSDNQDPPNYQHSPDTCRVRGDGSTANEAQANSSAANNPNNNKYCNCCYCEFFGNGGPANAQANRNTKIRERLQRKLHTKAKESESGEGKAPDRKPKKNHRPTPSESAGIKLAPVNDLVSFIEGDKRSVDGKKSKKGRQKQHKKEAKQFDDSGSTSLNEKLNTTQLQSNHDKTVNEKPLQVSRQSEGEEMSVVNGNEKSNLKFKKKKNKVEDAERDSKISSAVVQQNGARTKGGKSNPILNHDKAADKPKSDSKPKQLENDESKNTNKTPTVNGRDKIEKGKDEQDATKSGKKIPTGADSCRFKSDAVDSSLPGAGSNLGVTRKSSENRPNNEKGKSRRANKINSPVPSTDAKEAEDQSDQSSNSTARAQSKGKQPAVESASKQSNRKKDAKEAITTPQTKPQEIINPKNDSSHKHIDKNGFSNHPVSSKTDPVQTHLKNGFLTSKTATTDAQSQVKDKESSAESKKTRTRKQRKKSRQSAPSVDNNDPVDQVFLPREPLEKEMDDTEMEVENFKRFCLNSSALNKRKKITVKWKELNLKKNHFPN